MYILLCIYWLVASYTAPSCMRNIVGWYYHSNAYNRKIFIVYKSKRLILTMAVMAAARVANSRVKVNSQAS